MPSKLIDTFRRYSAELASAIAADNSEAIAALDRKLAETWDALLRVDVGDAGAARRLADFFLETLGPDDGSQLQSQALRRILELLETDRA